MRYKVSLVFLFLALMVHAQIRLNLSGDSPLRKLQMAEMAINNLYVDSVDEGALVEDAIRGMIEKLDPHSSYTNARDTKAAREPLQGDFEGIGVQFNMVEDTLLVIQPTLGGPSEKVGIVAGDRIVLVNDTAIAGVKMDRSEIMKRLRGKKGTKVRLGIVRRGVSEILEFVVKRDRIPVHSLTASYMIRPTVGYVRLENFGAKTHEELMQAIDSLSSQGMRSLILDLQDNGGGYLESAVQIANEFLAAGDMIVYTDGRATRRYEYTADGRGTLQRLPVTVLLNEYSASASEIVAGAIQDQDRGTIVGRRSFGKGLVQRPVELPDGSEIRLTVAHYYTPSGRCIQKPYKKGDIKDYQQDMENRLKHGELTCRDSIHFADSLLFHTLRENRPVYGGGGIMPDEFVPLDTMRYTRFHRKLIAKNIVINQHLRYIDNNRKQLHRSYKTFEQFLENYTVPESFVEAIISEGKRQGIEPRDDDELNRTLAYLRLSLKAQVARDLWDMNHFYQCWNENDDIVKAAIKN